MGEFTTGSGLVSRVSLERFPALVGGGGTDDLGGELDFSVERSSRTDAHELGTLLDKRGRAKVSVNGGSEAYVSEASNVRLTRTHLQTSCRMVVWVCG